jgi:signal transduction histidine kinase
MVRVPRVPSSIRWRLPITYAAIALLATVALGAVLLVTLQRFYAQRELDHLNRNSQTISTSIARLLEAGLPAATLRAQLEYFAFLAQARVRLFDTADRLLADTGVPQSISVAVIAEPASGVDGTPTYQPVFQIVSTEQSLVQSRVNEAAQFHAQITQTIDAAGQTLEQIDSQHSEAEMQIDALAAQLAHDGAWSAQTNEMAVEARDLVQTAQSKLDSVLTSLAMANETLNQARDQINATQAEVNGAPTLDASTQALLSDAQSQIEADYGRLRETWLQQPEARRRHDQIIRQFNSILRVRGETPPFEPFDFIAPASPLTPLPPREPIAPRPLEGPGSSNGDVIFSEDIAVNGSAFGFDLSADTGLSDQRSSQSVTQPVFGSTGALLGSVALSEGPAYGRDILDNIARGWVLASAIAIGLAAVAGWFISRRIARPIIKLTEVTSRMAEGSLSARATIAGDDEVGTLARTFNTMAERVEGTVTTLSRFAADAAHELKTPLTALRVDLDLVLDTPDGTPDIDAVHRAQGQIKRLDTLTSGLLDLSRLESGAGTLPLTLIDLGELVTSVVDVHASRAEQAGLSLVVDVAEGGTQIRGDESQLRRVVSNLLDNAIKFTSEGGTIRIMLWREEDWAIVTIEDTGVGVPAEDMPQLFSRFHRGRNTADYPGNGLGLAIVKAIVDNHQGQVSAENTPSGARFSVRLPLTSR